MQTTMQVDNLFDRIEALEIDLSKDVEEKFIRGSGAGGQKINKTSNNVQLIHLRKQLPAAVRTSSRTCTIHPHKLADLHLVFMPLTFFPLSFLSSFSV